MGYVNAMTAQYHGARRPERCVQSVTQGLWLSLAFAPLLLALVPLVHRGFAWAGHSPRQVELEFAYFRVLMTGSVLFLVQAALTGFFVGIGRTRVVMLANLVGILANVPLNWALVLGRLGLPALGIEGAALGTLAGALVIVTILFAAYLRSPEWRAHGGARAWLPRRDLVRRLLRYGTPAGAESLVNVFAFNVFVQLMHGYGPAVASAVTITFNYDLVAFIPMLGIGAAVTALTGQAIGAGDTAGARRTAFLGLRVAWTYAGVMMVLFVVGAPALVRVFSRGFGAGDAAILPLAETLLRLAAVYTLADATQIVFAGALRGAGDTTWVMIISGILHWLMAVTAFVLIRIVALPPVAVWLVFIGFVVSMGVAMWLRHRYGGWERIRMVEEAPRPSG